MLLSLTVDKIGIDFVDALEDLCNRTATGHGGFQAFFLLVTQLSMDLRFDFYLKRSLRQVGRIGFNGDFYFFSGNLDFFEVGLGNFGFAGGQSRIEQFNRAGAFAISTVFDRFVDDVRKFASEGEGGL